MHGSGAKSAVEWLVSAAPDPGACRWEWERGPSGVALLPAGELWDVLILPGELGRPTLDVLTRVVDRPGPVLADFGDGRVGFFVPPGTVARWVGTGVRGAGRGTWIVVPHPARATGTVRWLIPPDGSGTLTDPALLELAMHEAAARLAPGAVPEANGAEELGAVPEANGPEELGAVPEPGSPEDPGSGPRPE
ncbi:hypothetical protein GCM10018785_40510 [Streptomyces longispororuber]|uniref:DNA primase/polymerase bifunctional N-terminal domain-containing protein n=1 Tax=Streptomyces longispororuber TaxID=68230 RepID=A0A919DPX7_9ACTN|nr:hypothetical protein [Streptomyces longispororuber]GHE67812.1 hypothetical protein GCM10018785_40510 [Streptomyces longispororuber]